MLPSLRQQGAAYVRSAQFFATPQLTHRLVSASESSGLSDREGPQVFPLLSAAACLSQSLQGGGTLVMVGSASTESSERPSMPAVCFLVTLSKWLKT